LRFSALLNFFENTQFLEKRFSVSKINWKIYILKSVFKRFGTLSHDKDPKRLKTLLLESVI
jgi:hypothetical protein